MCYANEQATHVLAEVEIAAEGHLIVHHEATETNSEYWECAVCGELFSDEAGSTQISAIPAAEEDNTGEVVGLSVGGAAVARLRAAGRCAKGKEYIFLSKIRRRGNKTVA